MELKQEHIVLQNNTRKFVQKEVEPLSSKIDQENYFPLELTNKLAAMGLFGILVPENYEGFGFDTISYAIVLEEIAKSSGSLALIVAVHNGLVTSRLLLSGSEDLKKKYLPALCTGERLGGVDGCGSNGLIVEGTAVTGSAQFVLNGQGAGLLILSARKNTGQVHCMIEVPKAGVKMSPRDDFMGMRGTGIALITIDRVPVESASFLDMGKESDEAEALFNIGMAAISIGICQACFEAALKYSKERRQFGQAICNFDMVQDMLSEIALSAYVARLIVYDAAQKRDAGKPFVKEALMAKIYAARSAAIATRLVFRSTAATDTPKTTRSSACSAMPRRLR